MLLLLLLLGCDAADHLVPAGSSDTAPAADIGLRLRLQQLQR
jgi:hypothetical protein